jgi:hypothetical protein
MKSDSLHLSTDDLLALAAGDAGGRVGRRSHAEACEECGARLRRLGLALSVIRRPPEDAPARFVAAAKRAFAPTRAARDESVLAAAARKILAVLSFDSAGLTQAYGVRAGQAAARQLIYAAGGFDVDVRVRPAGGRWAVSGQVLGGATCAGGSAELARADEGEETTRPSRGDEAAARVELDETCEFVFPAVAAGAYALRLRLGDAEIEIPDITLG